MLQGQPMTNTRQLPTFLLYILECPLTASSGLYGSIAITSALQPRRNLRYAVRNRLGLYTPLQLVLYVYSFPPFRIIINIFPTPYYISSLCNSLLYLLFILRVYHQGINKRFGLFPQFRIYFFIVSYPSIKRNFNS